MRSGTNQSIAAHLSCALLLAAALLAGCSRSGTDAAAPATAPEPAAAPTAETVTGTAELAEPTESQLEAAAILKEMAEHLASLKSFSCTSRQGYEVVQANGQKIEFGETRRISLARPDRLRVEEVSSDGRRNLALFDGKLMTVFNADAGVYAQAPQPAPIDDALVYFVRDLRMRMPLALMLSTHVGTDLPAKVLEVDYVENTEILGRPAHHVAGRTDAIDFQFWIAEGDDPLPLRVVLTYRDEPGQPQFWSDFTDWNTKPKLTGATFQLSLPKDAQQIPFVVQVPAPGNPGIPKAANGEVKP